MSTYEYFRFMYIQNGGYIIPVSENYSQSTAMVSMFSSVSATSFPFPFGLLLLSQKTEITCSQEIAEGKSHQELSTVTALVDSSDNECLIFEAVRPPQENARSTSVDVAMTAC